jgi:hypothetical protein
VKRLLPILLLATLSLSLLSTTPVAAHESVAETSITISTNKDSIKRGQQVKIRGELESRRRRCYDRELVTLYVDGVPVKAKETRPNGKFNFKVRPAATADWHVEYAGRISGRHPHVHVCLGSVSNVVTIEVHDR